MSSEMQLVDSRTMGVSENEAGATERQAPNEDDGPRFSLFDHFKSVTPCDSITASELVAGIQNGRWKDQVEDCRNVLKSHGILAYKASREALPAVTLSALVNHRRKSTSLAQKGAGHSGYLQLDFDAKDHPGRTVAEIRFVVEAAPFVHACFESPSGEGIKALAVCPANFDSHCGCWDAVDAYFKERGLTLDPATADPLHLCFVSYDPDAFIRADATAIVPMEGSGPSLPRERSEGSEDPDHVRCVLAKLAKKIGWDLPRNTWLHILAATKDAVGPDLACELVDEFFPPAKPGHQCAAEVVGTLSGGAWLSLRKYGIDPADHLKSLPMLSDDESESRGAAKLSLREQAYKWRFNPDNPPPPDEICMFLGDYPIGSRGNLTVIQGKSKVGKSAVVAAVIGSALREEIGNGSDTLGICWEGTATGAVIHLDTEQSPGDWHELVGRSIIRSGSHGNPSRLISLPLVRFSRSERVEILRQTLEYETRMKGGVDIVVIDGVADLCLSPNDETESLGLASILLALAHEFRCMILCVLHENPGSEVGKTRGHLGSELNRKGFANLRIDKDAAGVSTMWGNDMRKREIPNTHGFCFAWDEAQRMHAYRGRASDVKAVQRETVAMQKGVNEWSRIFASTGQRDLSPDEAVAIVRDMGGTAKVSSIETMKKRMQRAETLGVLMKGGRGRWMLRALGQTGQNDLI